MHLIFVIQREIKLEFLKYNEKPHKIEFNESNTKSITGITSLQLKKGTASFSKLSFFVQPDTEAFFKVSSNSITRYYSEFFPSETNISDFQLKNKYIYIFSIQFRKCEIG